MMTLPLRPAVELPQMDFAIGAFGGSACGATKWWRRMRTVLLGPSVVLSMGPRMRKVPLRPSVEFPCGRRNAVM
eukprot:7517842-Pyramimonas_sp.AAC.1